MRLALIPLMVLPICLSAQMLRTVPAERDGEHPAFDPAFIQRNGVLSISGVPSVKPDGRPMRELPDRLTYHFDEEGRMVQSQSSRGRPGTGLDTTSFTWTHDAELRTISELRNDLTGHYLLERALDSLGRIIRESYVRVANAGPDRYHFQVGERTEISSESYTYRIEGDSAWVRVYLNNLGLPYREQRHAHDRLGYLRCIEDHYLVSGRRSTVHFLYDEKGRLSERLIRPDLQGTRTTRETYAYDTAGNLLVVDVHQDGRHTRHEELMYEERTMFLKARLTRDLTTGQIHVVRYHTTRR